MLLSSTNSQYGVQDREDCEYGGRFYQKGSHGAVVRDACFLDAPSFVLCPNVRLLAA